MTVLFLKLTGRLGTPSNPTAAWATRHWGALASLAVLCLCAAAGAIAADNEGTALQAAFITLEGMSNGYGKQILVLMGFVMAAIGFIVTNASGVVMKFIGYAIFLGSALGAAATLVGAVI